MAYGDFRSPNILQPQLLSGLLDQTFKGYQQGAQIANDRRRAQTLAELGQAGNMNPASLGQALIGAGDLEGGLAAIRLGELQADRGLQREKLNFEIAALNRKAENERSANQAFQSLIGSQGAPASASGALGAASNAISGIESGGRYDAVGPQTRTGDRAFGKYQVMGANVGPWTEQYVGRRMTPQEFLASPEAQEAVFQGEFGRLKAKHGPEGAARAWFAGEGGMNDPNRRDVLGTTVQSYGQKFSSAFNRQTGGQAQGAPVQVAQAGGVNDASGQSGQFDSPLSRASSAQIQALIANPSLPDGQRQLLLRELDRRQKTTEPTTEQRNLDAINRQRAQAGLPPYRLDEWKIEEARARRSEVRIDQRQESKFAETAGKAIAERMDKIANDGDQAIVDKALVGQLRELGDRIQTGGIAVVKQWLGERGIKTEGLDDIQAYSALIDRLTPQQRVPGSGATSDFDARMFKNSLPRLINTPEGNRIIVETMDALADNRLRRAEIAGQILNGDIDRKEGMRMMNEVQKDAKRLETRIIEASKARPVSSSPQQQQSPQGRTQSGVQWRVVP